MTGWGRDEEKKSLHFSNKFLRFGFRNEFFFVSASYYSVLDSIACRPHPPCTHSKIFQLGRSVWVSVDCHFTVIFLDVRYSLSSCSGSCPFTVSVHFHNCTEAHWRGRGLEEHRKYKLRVDDEDFEEQVDDDQVEEKARFFSELTKNQQVIELLLRSLIFNSFLRKSFSECPIVAQIVLLLNSDVPDVTVPNAKNRCRNNMYKHPFFMFHHVPFLRLFHF